MQGHDQLDAVRDARAQVDAPQALEPRHGQVPKAHYHCRREGTVGRNTCKCDAHPPCVVKQGYVLRECPYTAANTAHGLATPHSHGLTAQAGEKCNKMLHGNVPERAEHPGLLQHVHQPPEVRVVGVLVEQDVRAQGGQACLPGRAGRERG